MDETPIGLIGIGLLGTALAERILGAGLPVLGYDVQTACVDRLRASGGQPAGDVREIAERCEQIVLCLPDSDAVGKVIESFGERLTRGKLVVDATTGDPEATALLAARLAQRGVGYVDATIAGSSEQARQGAAVVIVGGTDSDVQRVERILATWSDRRFHVGPAGSGARLKLIVNLVLGLNRAVLAEGLSLARACAIDLTKALEVLKTTPAYSTVMDTKGAKMIARDYSPQARIAQHLKDVRLIRELAGRHDARTPLSDVHEALLRRAVEIGFGEADNSAVIEAYRK